MLFRSLLTIFTVTLFWLVTFFITPQAQALTPIKILDISYKDCPAELAEGNVTSGGAANPATCYLITGKAKNPSGKTVYDADVYGQIYDANHEPILQNRSRVGSITEIPPGVSNFEIRVSVPSNQPTPLKLEKFKASGFSTKVYPSF
jgi:hypothetical protein